MFKIAICGKANSGKNSLGTIIHQEIFNKFPYEAIKKCELMAFADPIKEMVMLLYPQAKREYLFGASQLRAENIPNAFSNEQPITYRQVLLDLGKMGRKYDPDIWVKNFEQRYQSFKAKLDPTAKKYQTLIVPDVRFKNEATHLIKSGFYLIKLIRLDNKIKIKDISETEQDSIADTEFNQIIYNERDLNHLKSEVIAKLIPNIK